jgi:hypothetical protein
MVNADLASRKLTPALWWVNPTGSASSVSIGSQSEVCSGRG